MDRVVKQKSNQVYLDDDGVIHSVYHGPQTGEGLKKTIERILRLMEIMIRNDRPVKLLVDMRDMGEYTTAARLVEMHARTILPFWKMAFVTSRQHPSQEEVSRKLTLMSGRRKEIRYFEREDDAVGWLSYI